MNELAKAELLQSRLEAIGQSLAQTPGALALLGLGSAGQETARLDKFSDLDFFVFVEAGAKQRLLFDLIWLERVAPVLFNFMNTADGYKLLFADGVFCEFSVFAPTEIQTAAFSPGRIIWQADSFDAALAIPQPRPAVVTRAADWIVSEALTNLYVGLGRYWRGEKISATRFVEGYAVDRLIELAPHIFEPVPAVAIDVFDRCRRFECQYPSLAVELPNFMQGYRRIPQSAAAILQFLDRHFTLNDGINRAIVALCKRASFHTGVKNGLV